MARLKYPIEVSSLSFSKEKWTRSEAVKWLREHEYGEFKVAGFKATKNYWRVQVVVVEPNTCRYRQEHWGSSGIMATYCIPKNRSPKTVNLGRVARVLKTKAA